MKLNLTNHIDKVIYYWRCWEPYETWAVGKFLQPGDTFVDVGANIGYFTLLASKIVGAHGKIISFEPVPPTAARLKENVNLNGAGNVVIHEYAVSDQPGTVRIGKCFGGDPGMSTLRINEMTNEVWEVPAVRLDQILPRDRSIRLVKIDVEGAELRVLKGLTGYLKSRNSPYVLCEINDSFLKDLGGSAEELCSWMFNLGYCAYSCKNRRLTPISLRTIREAHQMNVLFLK